MALIKHAESGLIARDAVVLDLGDLHRQGEELRAKAQRDAEAIIADAEREAARLIEEAKARGFEEGQQAGIDQGRNAGFEAGRNAAFEEQYLSLQRVVTSWGEALETFVAARDALLRDAREDVLELGVRVGERVLRREIEHDRGAAARQLEAALDLALSATSLRIEICAGDLDAVTESLPGLLGKFAGTPHAEVIEAPDIEPGGCRVRTEAGVIDAQINGQLDRLVSELLSAGGSQRWAPEADDCSGEGADAPDDTL